MNLQQQLSAAEKNLQEFADALEIIKSKPRWEPAAGENSALDFLKLELQSRSSEAEQQQLIRDAEAAHVRAKLDFENIEFKVKNNQEKLDALVAKFEDQKKSIPAAQSRLLTIVENLQSIGREINQHSEILNGQKPIWDELAFEAQMPDCVGNAPNFRIGAKLHSFQVRSVSMFG